MLEVDGRWWVATLVCEWPSAPPPPPTHTHQYLSQHPCVQCILNSLGKCLDGCLETLNCFRWIYRCQLIKCDVACDDGSISLWSISGSKPSGHKQTTMAMTILRLWDWVTGHVFSPSYVLECISNLCLTSCKHRELERWEVRTSLTLAYTGKRQTLYRVIFNLSHYLRSTNTAKDTALRHLENTRAWTQKQISHVTT